MNDSDAAQKLERLQAVCEAIAHPARRQILLTIHLRGGEVTAGAIAGRFAHAWPTTTRHLGVLVESGLLRQRKSGREVFYRLSPSAFRPLAEWLGWFGVASVHGETAVARNASLHSPSEGEPASKPPSERAEPERGKRQRKA